MLLLEDVPDPSENTTVTLRLIPDDDTLWITAMLLGSDSAVLYETEVFADTPVSNLGVLPSTPPGLRNPVPDVGGPFMGAESAWVGVGYAEVGTPAPVEIVLDNLEYDLYDAPTLAIEKSVQLMWSGSTAQDQVAVGATTIDGPWIPVLEPVFERYGSLCISVPATFGEQWLKPYEYFALTPGYQLRDDFSDVDRQWWHHFHDAREFQIRHVDGALNIASSTAGTYGRASLAALPPSAAKPFVHQDFAMSIDIIDWEPSGESQVIGLIGRVELLPDFSTGHNYMGIVGFQNDGTAFVSIYDSRTNSNLATQEDVAVDPEKSYRLIFCGAGSQLLLRLSALDNPGESIAELEANDSGLTQGVPALWVNAGTGTYDLTIDNYFVSGTKAR